MGSKVRQGIRIKSICTALQRRQSLGIATAKETTMYCPAIFFCWDFWHRLPLWQVPIWRCGQMGVVDEGRTG